MSKHFKIYVDGKLRLICGSPFVLMNNVTKLEKQYGKDRVEVKEYEVNELNKVELQQLRESMDHIFKEVGND